LATAVFSYNRYHLSTLTNELKSVIYKNVADALAEDVGSGDLTASLVDADAIVGAKIIARQAFVLAGQYWADEVFHQLDRNIKIDWYVSDGQRAGDAEVL